MKLRGNNLILFWKEPGSDVWTTLAYARSCELDLQAELREVGSRLTGTHQQYRKGLKGWTVRTGHLMAGKAGLLRLLALAYSDDEVPVMLATVADGGFDPDTVETDGRRTWSGRALVTRLTVTALKGSKATLSIEMEGQGRLTHVDAPWILEEGWWNDGGVWIDCETWNDGET